MAIVTRVEEAVDVQKVLTTTTTYQSVTEITPNTDVKAYRLEQSDTVWTCVEEKVSKEQQVYQGGVDGSVANDPLETHNLFKEVDAKVKSNWLKWKAGQATDPVNWNPSTETDAQFVLFYAKYIKGFETFYSSRIVLRTTALEDRPPSQANLGKIENRGVQALGITPPAGVNFILSAARGNQEGELWRNSYEWLGSAANGQGWNPLIYSPEG